MQLPDKHGRCAQGADHGCTSGPRIDSADPLKLAYECVYVVRHLDQRRPQP